MRSSVGFRWPGRKLDQPDNVRSRDTSFVAAVVLQTSVSR
jgi:hypothetical protein